MSRRLLYFDTSAAIKLFKREAESDALGAWLSTQGSALVITSDLTRTELRRALHTAQAAPATWQQVEQWLDEAALIRLTPSVFDTAGRLSPNTALRSLDALHVAAAMTVAPAVTAFVAYDKRLLAAAETVGLRTSAPA